jgi:hypothetical protein
MLRFFAFPDRVERISSNNDRRKILQGFAVAGQREIAHWDDRQLDDQLFGLRTRLEAAHPSVVLDFYESPLKEQWAGGRKIKTLGGEVTVTVPGDEDETEDKEQTLPERTTEARQSIQVQAKLARIGSIMGFKVWIPRADRNRVKELLTDREHAAFIEGLPLNYDSATIDTIELIDILWLKGRSIVRAFEVEHTTAVYSGLLRMADLLALQPNMAIRLHIVAPDERREKVFREMRGRYSRCSTVGPFPIAALSSRTRVSILSMIWSTCPTRMRPLCPSTRRGQSRGRTAACIRL